MGASSKSNLLPKTGSTSDSFLRTLSSVWEYLQGWRCRTQSGQHGSSQALLTDRQISKALHCNSLRLKNYLSLEESRVKKEKKTNMKVSVIAFDGLHQAFSEVE